MWLLLKEEAATGPTVRMGQWVLLVHSSTGHVTANVRRDVACEVRLVRCRVFGNPSGSAGRD